MPVLCLLPRAAQRWAGWLCALCALWGLAACAQPGGAPPAVPPQAWPHAARIDSLVRQAMADTGARGLALAVVERGQPVWTQAWGVRDAQGAPLREDTVMYGASLTKAAFGYFVLQLVDEGRLDLDTPLARYLPQPLPSYRSADVVRRYSAFAGLENDARWRQITARMLLTHSAGFANFYFLEPDRLLRIHFEPGSRYAYSGDGLILLQFVLEQGLGLDVGAEMQRRLFTPLGMARTSLLWRADFRPNLADGFGQDGRVEPHDERSRVRASGSMDTSIADMAQLAAALVRGHGLSAAQRRAWTQPQLGIASRSQFPSLAPPPAQPVHPGLAAGLGVIAFAGPQGPGFFKGGHNDVTANTWVCLDAGQRCVVLLANDVRAEPAFPALVAAILGDTGLPWAWEYGGLALWPGPRP